MTRTQSIGHKKDRGKPRFGDGLTRANEARLLIAPATGLRAAPTAPPI